MIVCGGRDYSDKDRMFAEIEENRPTFLIEGGASGADTLARKAADALMIPHITVWALWGPPGARIAKAGYDRNMLMAKIMDKLGGDNEKTVLALPGGTGTNMMVDIGRRYNFDILDRR